MQVFISLAARLDEHNCCMIMIQLPGTPLACEKKEMKYGQLQEKFSGI